MPDTKLFDAYSVWNLNCFSWTIELLIIKLVKLLGISLFIGSSLRYVVTEIYKFLDKFRYRYRFVIIVQTTKSIIKRCFCIFIIYEVLLREIINFVKAHLCLQCVSFITRYKKIWNLFWKIYYFWKEIAMYLHALNW